ncbi:ATP-binding protein [Shewanella putrefaciens]|uniref:ATP-binding protein n=1 Tax=Shewanella putrefaciens TaxID=24 RepID=UPI0018E75F06|nr:transporter substrate-binding domain-containing protein [Shewanella putrefaciens]
MKNVMYILILSFITSYSFSHENTHKNYQLSNYPNNTNLPIQLSSEDQKNLNNYQTLNIGISAPDYPPFDMTANGEQESYKGISADYLAIIAKVLNVKVNIKRYLSRDKLITAALNGDVDLITTANKYEQLHGLILSTPYVIDKPSVFRNIHLGENETIKSMSMAYEYLPDEAITKIYPERKLIKFPSRQAAIAAAALGQVDAVIIDQVSANYLINNIYSGKLRLDTHLPLNSYGNAFASSAANEALIDIINNAISNISLEQRKLIRKRWSGGGSTIPFPSELPIFTADELAWLEKNPKVTIAINKYAAPVTYLDDADNAEGYGIEVLELIQIYSGLTFDYIVNNRFSEQLTSILNHKAMIAIFSPDEDMNKRISFTRDFSNSPYVLVTHKQAKNIENDIIVIPDGVLNINILRKNFPNADIIITDNYLEALNNIATGSANTTIAPMVLADFYVNSYFSDVLEVSKIIDEIPEALVSFAIASSNPLLKSILNKTLAVIPPDELQMAENRWRRNALPARQSWKDYKYTISTIIIASAIMILISIIWALYTHTHYRKRLLAKKELNQQLQFMQSIVDAIPHPIYVRNKRRELTMCNESYLAAFEATREELLHKTTVEGINRSQEAPEVDREYMQALEDGIAVFKDRELHINGKKYNIYHWFKSYGDETGNVEGIIGGWIDVSDRVRLIKELEHAKEVADSASQAKSTFLAIMSHEIRTPMNAIIGMLELALKRANTQQFDFNSIKVAYDSANGLLELIGDILDIARIEAGQLTLSPIRANLKTIVTSVVRVFDGLAKQKGINLELDFDPDINKDVLVDPMRIKQILSNLIGNAIKFTDSGLVTIKIQSESLINTKRSILFTVTDTGIGISEKDQQKLFTPFSQAHGTTNTYGGTGLGLMICHSLCEMMGGKITLESYPNQGTKISMRLTLIQFEEDASTATMHTPIDMSPMIPLDILIVDDHPANRLLLAQQLTYLGHKVDEAENGVMALVKFEDKQYQMIVTDCNMPEMDGYELCRKIRIIEKNFLYSPVIIGYTANAQKDAKEACLNAGMNDCLFKPISLAELEKMLRHFSPEKEIMAAPHFEATSVEKLTGNNTELVDKLLRELLKSNQADLAALYRAFKTQDLNSVKELAHKIKGAARIIDAKRLVAICEKLEHPHLYGDLSAHIAQLEADIFALEEEVTTYLTKLYS